ncbi:MAG: MarR family transcriptional regulator [Thermoplasmata archaeon]|nr:MarR family transcriptional regulator [Thermoplasmata archaeon]
MADPYDCLRLENQLCFPLYVCAKEVVRRYKPFLDPLDLTYTQYITMMVMWGRDRISVKDIGALLHLDSGTLTPLLHKLEEKGYVERSRDPYDERSVIIGITSEGEALKEKAKDIPAAVGFCLNISAEDAQVLYGILTRMMVSFGSSD